MIRKLPLFLLGWLCGSASAIPQDWAVAGAPWRVALHASDAPGAPDAGWEIDLPDFGGGRPDMRDVVLMGPDGKEIALDCIWRSNGNRLLVLANSMPADKAATLYFGGEAAHRMQSWSASRSLLLETRRLPEGANLTTFAGWQDAWKRSPAVDGMDFVPMIFQGGNPFGDEGRYLSRYTGTIRSGDGGEMEFYTLSNEVSYVMMDGSQVMSWRKKQPTPVDPRVVPLTKVRMNRGGVKVEYCHGVGDGQGATVLGWKQAGKFDNVPPSAWVHPGNVNVGAFESADGSPVPLANLVANNYVGFGGEWYVSVSASIPDPGAGWQVEWLWPDGRTDHGTDVQRLWMNLDPLRVIIRMRNGSRGIEGRRTVMVPHDLKMASVNRANQINPFLSLLEKEDPSVLSEPARKAGFVLARGFLPQPQVARWAEAWLEKAKPDNGYWIVAMSLAVQEISKTDPKAALARLENLSAEGRKALGRTADLLELDVRVFRLNDPLVVGLVARLCKSGDKLLARMATVRLGDYQLLNGRIDEAARCYADAAVDNPKPAGQAPVIDRARSLAIEELVNDSHPEEAIEKMGDWERERPSAKLESDQLLWRARVMLLVGDWQRALQDLETSLKARPGSPEEIEVRFWQGRALYELGRKDEARKVWNQIVKDYPKHERTEEAKSWAKKS